MRETKTHLVNRFTSEEYTYNNLFKSLLCYVLYSVRLEIMRQDIADWPSSVWRRVRITSTIALGVVKGDGKGIQCRGVKLDHPVLAGYKYGDLGSRLEESRI
jgi:hypothetical protein